MEQQLLHVRRGMVEEKKALILYFGGNDTNSRTDLQPLVACRESSLFAGICWESNQTGMALDWEYFLYKIAVKVLPSLYPRKFAENGGYQWKLECKLTFRDNLPILKASSIW